MAGMTNANFDQLDMQGDECAQINQAVIDWALANASTEA